MKIERVILASNDNPTYYHFWNPLSKVYFEKFNILPTLIWFGTKEQIKEFGLSEEYGQIIPCESHPDYPVPFQTTWALFWGTQFYSDETCLTIGIDQVPLSGIFIKEMIKDTKATDYAMLIADAYLPHHWSKEGSASPTAYHIGKGRTFNEVYLFEKDFKKEIEKICKSGTKAFWEDSEGRWGMDETYSSMMLRKYKGNIVSLNNFGLLCERRIECERHKETPFDETRMKNGWYSESHLCRPFTNHTEYIMRMFNSIQYYK